MSEYPRPHSRIRMFGKAAYVLASSIEKGYFAVLFDEIADKRNGPPWPTFFFERDLPNVEKPDPVTSIASLAKDRKHSTKRALRRRLEAEKIVEQVMGSPPITKEGS